jgi:pyruvate-formate lyase-activating enzyme
MEWSAFCSSLDLDAEREHRVEGLLTACKESFATLCLRRTRDGGASPVARLAAYWSAHPDLDAEALEAAFLSYLRGAEEGSGCTYLAAGDGIVRAVEARLLEQVSEDQRRAYTALELDSLLEVETPRDPLGERVGELLAGLPPPVGARAVQGLPEPEEHGAKFQGLFCAQPFEYAQADPLGRLYLCCPQTLPKSAGVLGGDGFMSVWNSSDAVAIRESILDGSFKYCSEATCGVLQSRRLPRVDEVADPAHRRILDERLTTLERGPSVINLAYDRSCNLACPSCRSELIILRGKARQRAQAIQEQVLGAHLADARRLIITGSGDPFGSRLYLSFLRTFDPATVPGLRIQLSTNGLLLTEAMWDSICHRAVDAIDVSVDAATPETYTLNRGGDFARLVENLRFMGRLRRAGRLARFDLHYVVQANNVREMEAFVALGREVGCDTVCFKQLVNWGTYSEAEYWRRAVQRPEHPRHGELLRVLRVPVFARSPVYLHDLSHLLPGA